MREAKNEIMFGDIDLNSLNDFLELCVQGEARIVHQKMTIPSRLGMSLFMSAFEDLMSMKTRAFLVKDIDPRYYKDCLGQEVLLLNYLTKNYNEYYLNKAPIPTDSQQLLNLMSHGGGLDKSFNNPLYKEKLQNIDIDIIESWVEELCQKAKL